MRCLSYLLHDPKNWGRIIPPLLAFLCAFARNLHPLPEARSRLGMLPNRDRLVIGLSRTGRRSHELASALAGINPDPVDPRLGSGGQRPHLLAPVRWIQLDG